MTYQLFGALGSPYSQKIRALLRYRRLPYIWVDEAARRQAALGAVKAPVIPVLEYPDGTFANDSTPLVYDLEARHAARGVVPPDPAQAFIAHLLEDVADGFLLLVDGRRRRHFAIGDTWRAGAADRAL